jgi:hypothetical protein
MRLHELPQEEFESFLKNPRPYLEEDAAELQLLIYEKTGVMPSIDEIAYTPENLNKPKYRNSAFTLY